MRRFCDNADALAGQPLGRRDDAAIGTVTKRAGVA